MIATGTLIKGISQRGLKSYEVVPHLISSSVMRRELFFKKRNSPTLSETNKFMQLN